MQSKSSPTKKIKKDKYSQKLKSVKGTKSDLVEDYYEAMPLIDQYASGDETFENIDSIDDYIFTFFNHFFIREMLYFDSNERRQLIEDILQNKEKTDEQIKYNPPLTNIGMDDKIRIYIRSLVEPGEKTKIIIIETSELVSIVKEQIGILFDYGLDDFLLSTGGILLDETKQIKDYSIDDDDEIAIIPRSIKK
jgi:hypothetical protein